MAELEDPEKQGRLEKWGPFGRGWRCERAAMDVVGDNPWPVLAYAKVWSPGIERVEAEVVNVAAMTAESLDATDLTGKIVLVENPREVKEPFDGVSKRHDAESLLRLADQQRIEAQRPERRVPEQAHADRGPDRGVVGEANIQCVPRRACGLIVGSLSRGPSAK